MIVKMEAGTLEFEPTCPIDTLEIRAQIEGVKL